MSEVIGDLKKKWRGMKATSGFHDFVLFLVFIGIAAFFWLVMSLNDNVTRTFDVSLRIENVPDSVTFINDPPKMFHVILRDKGTNIVRSGVFSHPHVNVNFMDYGSEGIFRMTRSDLTAALKSTFGSAAQITSVSLDSLNLRYTTDKGRRVPVVVNADVTAAPGMVISETPKPVQRYALIYSYSTNIDTITRVYTQPVVRRNLKETTEVEVPLLAIPSVKIVPSSVIVRIPVEPLVKKESMATVSTLNVPEGESLLLFPNKVQVVYYVPMSLFNSDLIPVEVAVDYADIYRYSGDRLPVSIRSFADYVASPQIHVDSVEYTLVKHK